MCNLPIEKTCKKWMNEFSWLESWSQETDSLETRAELAVLRIHIETQAILELILLH